MLRKRALSGAALPAAKASVPCRTLDALLPAKDVVPRGTPDALPPANDVVSCNTLDALPPELIVHITRFLIPIAFRALAGTCRFIRDCVCDKRVLYELMTQWAVRRAFKAQEQTFDGAKYRPVWHRVAELPNGAKHGLEERFLLSCNVSQLIQSTQWCNGRRHGVDYTRPFGSRGDGVVASRDMVIRMWVDGVVTSAIDLTATACS
jgi:hypothetical protein